MEWGNCWGRGCVTLVDSYKEGDGESGDQSLEQQYCWVGMCDLR